LAATAVASEFASVTFKFDEEPGEYRWVISQPRLGEIELTILEFSKHWGGETDSSGKVLFRTRCVPTTFSEAVQSAAARVLEKHGEAGYLAGWKPPDA
jgi:hypothetical protein